MIILKNIDQYIAYCKEHQINFDQLIEDYQNQCLNDEHKEFFYQVMDDLREELKDDQVMLEPLVQGLVEKIENINYIDNLIDQSLSQYRNMERLRQLEKEDSKQLFNFLVHLFDEYIVRTDPYFLEHASEFGFSSKQEMEMIAEHLDSMVHYYVYKRLTQKYIQMDLRDELGVSLPTCHYISELIEKNFQSICLGDILSSLTVLMKKSD